MAKRVRFDESCAPSLKRAGRALALLSVGLCLGGAGCFGGLRPRPELGPATDRVEMEPLQVVAVRRGDRLEIVHRDAASVFRDAGAAYEAQDFPRAAELYQLLLREFPGSSYELAARYNLGLSLEETGAFAEALTQYRAIIASTPDSADGIDARFRLAQCQRALGDPAGALATLQELLAKPGLGRNDRSIAELRLGAALLELGRLDDAERIFRGLMGQSRLKGQPGPLPISDQLLADANFGLAQVEHERFRRVQIRLPQERMEQDINDKARGFLRAQAGYLRTIRLRQPDLVTAAGLKIGILYEEFYEELMRAPVPPELNAEEVEVYFEELRKVIRPLVEQAIHVYERNLLYAERMGEREGNEWVAQTHERLERLQRFLKGDGSLEPGAVPMEPPPAAATEPLPAPPQAVGPELVPAP